MVLPSISICSDPSPKMPSKVEFVMASIGICFSSLIMMGSALVNGAPSRADSPSRSFREAGPETIRVLPAGILTSDFRPSHAKTWISPLANSVRI